MKKVKFNDGTRGVLYFGFRYIYFFCCLSLHLSLSLCLSICLFLFVYLKNKFLNLSNIVPSCKTESLLMTLLGEHLTRVANVLIFTRSLLIGFFFIKIIQKIGTSENQNEKAFYQFE